MAVRRFLAYDLVSRSRIHRRAGARQLGSSACGWIVPADGPRTGEVCYCFGAGEDISFDIALHRECGCTVHTFDPTPRAIAHYQSLPQADREAVTFHPVGIWTEDRTMQFFAPVEGNHVSHSLVLNQSTKVGFSAECLTFPTLQQRVGGAQPALVKMDIEGAEMQVLEHLLATATPRILLVEFDELNPLTSSKNWQRVRSVINGIKARGYRIFEIDRLNYSFERIAEAPIAG
ncbi:MAG: FkbM family methyltransferase [Candidatus Didemnitutus sp.]|nr:FkbM family methyltransferase [Candidatus Didemnitutus sp.]